MIHINFGGCDSRHASGLVIDNPHGNQDYLIIIAKTNAIFEIDGLCYETMPGTMVLFDKNVSYRYGNNHGDYINDWLHFDICEEELLLPSLSIPFNKVISLGNLSGITLIISQIIVELFSDSPYRVENMNSFMHILLFRLSDQIHSKEDPVKSHPLYAQMSALRANIYNSSEEKWTIARMCSKLHISQSYFQHLYQKMFQTSCINDLINARIEAAKYRLHRTDFPINVIAELCGYENTFHFCRQFKKNTGLSPREYRNKLSKKDYIPSDILNAPLNIFFQP
jgi:AraC-type DNA-binding domain-containing proteins